MIWFEQQYDINGIEVQLEGTFDDSVVRITAIVGIDPDDPVDGWKYHCFYEKPVNMWVHQEVLAEDVLAKYQGMVKKCEKKLSALVEKHKINESI